MEYIDIHTHPFKEYYDDPHEEVKKWKEMNMQYLFVNGTSKEDCIELLDLCEKENYLFPVIGIGEVGLDYHYDDSPSKEIQKEGFISQIEVARKYNIPVVMHIRDALEDAYEIISNEKYNDMKFVFHSYSGDVAFTEKCLKHPNFYYSISGVVTFKNAKSLQNAVKIIPIDHIFCETDTPYLAPVPMRGSDNISPYVSYTYQYIAKLKNISEQELVNQIKVNVKKVFGV